MSETAKSASSRREFLKNGGRVVAASALLAGATPRVHAADNNTIQVALIGCGGRGTGAAANALSVPGGNTKLVAMADVFENRIKASYTNLSKKFEDKVDVPEDRRFLGFDGYKKAMDCLNPGDVAIFATPCGFREVHFTYAIKKGLNVFMEKPVTADGPSTRRMIKLAAEADKKNLKVGVGLMVRHCKGRQELHKRIKDGQIGQLIAMHAYRMAGPMVGFAGPKPDGITELMYQIQKFHSFLWASGGTYNDFYIHQIDECSWMKDAWPVEAKASGGRHYRHAHPMQDADPIDQNFDNYSVEYTYPDGTKLFYFGRNIAGCHSEFASYVHGTKGCGIVSTSSHTPGKVRLFSGQKFEKDALTWAHPQPEENPYQLEWNDLIAAIREDTPFNEVKRGAEASMVSSMGRMAAHTGQIITFDQMLNCEHAFSPDVAKITSPDSPAPLQAEANGRYPIPMPGLNKKREF